MDLRNRMLLLIFFALIMIITGTDLVAAVLQRSTALHLALESIVLLGTAIGFGALLRSLVKRP